MFSDLIGKKVDDGFLLIPPFYTTGGVDISIGRNVFVNQNCTFYDLGGLDIADDVMIGPNVSIINHRLFGAVVTTLIKLIQFGGPV